MLSAPIAITPRRLRRRTKAAAHQTARVAYLVGHHHTYTQIDGADYQILVEADFLVNLFEGNASREAILAAFAQNFKTQTGRNICREMFGM